MVKPGWRSYLVSRLCRFDQKEERSGKLSSRLLAVLTVGGLVISGFAASTSGKLAASSR